MKTREISYCIMNIPSKTPPRKSFTVVTHFVLTPFPTEMQMTAAFTSTSALLFRIVSFNFYFYFSYQLSGCVHNCSGHLEGQPYVTDAFSPRAIRTLSFAPHIPDITGMPTPMTADTLPVPPRLIRSVTFLVSGTLQWNSNESNAWSETTILHSRPQNTSLP